MNVDDRPHDPPSARRGWRDETTPPRIWRIGRSAWAIVGIAAAIAVAVWVASHLMLVIVPVVLALFPATLLMPVANWLKRRGLPASLAALLSLLGGIALIALVIGLMVPLVGAELPQLAETAGQGLAELERFLADGPLGLDFGGISGLVQQAGDQLGDMGGFAGPAMSAATAAIETVTGMVLLLVILFFYLKDGDRLGNGLLTTAPSQQRARLREIGARSWSTLGAFFRGQLLIAAVDAVAIGIGLALLRVPLALPLGVLIFFGGLFPIIGALITGILAVLVALAHGGLTLGLIVAALVVAVQQLEGNVLEPLILGHAVRVHPMIVILAVAAGAVTLGILGAFLAVPTAAIVARTITYLREEDREKDQVA